MMYSWDNMYVGIVKGDQEVARKCYQNNLRIKRVAVNVNPLPRYNSCNVNFVGLDLINKYLEDKLISIEDFKEIQIDLQTFQTKKVVTS